MRRTPVCTYQTNDSAATSYASSLVGAHSTMVKVAAWSLTNLPAGSLHSASPWR